MRPVGELISDDPAWPDIEAAAHGSPVPVELLPADAAQARQCLAHVQVTTRSWLGAIVFHTGGILVDHGWLRVFGSGDVGRRFVDIATANAANTDGLLVGVDVLGGLFSWEPSQTQAGPTIHYFGPDTLEWQDLECGYQHWLSSMLAGAIDEFYSSLRWPGWPAEVAECPLDRGINVVPPLFTREGKDPTRVSRRPIPMTELTSLYAGVRW
jgi:hypothetical protein